MSRSGRPHPSGSGGFALVRRRRRPPAAAVFLFAGGALLLGQAAWSLLRLERAQQLDRSALNAPAEVGPSKATAPADRRTGRPQPGALLGYLTIPGREVGTSIREGVGDDVLDVAAGHLPGTALPGELGNAAIAAHRDALFSGLRSVQRGDRVHVDTASGRAIYEIRDLQVVEPDDLSVLDPTPTPSLTLITCYPFTWVGPAPQRYVVRARLVDREPARP